MKKTTVYSGAILGISVIMIFILSFFMPEFPSYQVSNEKVIRDDGSTQGMQVSGVVVLDPGHGGYDIGAKSKDGSIVEKTYDLEMSLKIREYLVSHGVEVIMTRESDEVSWKSDNGKDLQARLDIATNANADLMVSIHCNKSNVDSDKASGSEVYVNEKQKDSLELATSIVSELDKIDSILNSRGIKTGTLHLTELNKVPTVIVEMGFLSNQEDVDFLNDEVCQEIMVRQIVKGILNYLEK